MKYTGTRVAAEATCSLWWSLPAQGELLSVFLTFLTVLCWISSALAVQALRGSVPDFQLNAFRMAGRSICFSEVSQISTYRLVKHVKEICVFLEFDLASGACHPVSKSLLWLSLRLYCLHAVFF